MLVDLNTMVDVPDLVQNGNITVYANTFTNITYATFYQSTVTINPTLQVSILNAQAGDYINVISQSITGFTIQCYNNNTPVTRTISWLAVGY